MAEFALLRPAWLLALIPLAVLTISVLRHSDPRRSWRGVVAPHLLEHMLVDPDRRQTRRRPAHGAALALALGIFALSGPSFGSAPSPFAEEQAVVVVISGAAVAACRAAPEWPVISLWAPVRMRARSRASSARASPLRQLPVSPGMTQDSRSEL